MNPVHNIMLDLETLGTTAGCVIVSIGACDFADGEIVRGFYKVIDLGDMQRRGFFIDPETMAWWMQQSDEARSVFSQPDRAKIDDVLENFAWWLNAPAVLPAGHENRIWGNGSDFDNAILSGTYQRRKKAVPWKFFNNRCYRTACDLIGQGVPRQQKGVYHNALDDAMSQALHLMRLWSDRASID